MKILDATEAFGFRLSHSDRGLDDRANALWEGRCTLNAELNKLGSERRRLTELLPWWAAPGRQLVDSEGNVSGNIVWYPAIQKFTLPSAGHVRSLRPSEYEIRSWFRYGFYTKEERAKRRKCALASLRRRLAAQIREQRRVGIHSINRAITHATCRHYAIDHELKKIAEQGSPAALAALVMVSFSHAHYPDSELSSSWDRLATLATLYQTQHSTTGLLARHVSLFIKHPRKQLKTCSFLTYSEDARAGFVRIDRERLDDAVMEKVRRRMDSTYQLAAAA